MPAELDFFIRAPLRIEAALLQSPSLDSKEYDGKFPETTDFMTSSSSSDEGVIDGGKRAAVVQSSRKAGHGPGRFLSSSSTRN
ncbi:hypothetical protein C5167_020632 [Papaver somniferum]|uniref:Uncharacterized protein n=1 Tax=Papaver somniferum TaxID=3469 RepID=A0A4Y7IXK0_PAPSO|nr:hypothetical protein C5167_020632 [Papaver somniferum]